MWRPALLFVLILIWALPVAAQVPRLDLPDVNGVADFTTTIVVEISTQGLGLEAYSFDEENIVAGLAIEAVEFDTHVITSMAQPAGARPWPG